MSSINIVHWLRIHSLTWVRRASFIFALFFIALFDAIAVWHLRYPYEVEWYEGLMMDHVMRIVSGVPIYARPNPYFAAALYQPLYYYILAPIVSHLTGPSFLAGRIVTVLATALTAVIIGNVVWNLTEKSLYAVVTALGLFFATYALTEYVQTVVRIDSTYVFFIIAGIYFLSKLRGWSVLLGALMFGAAYFTKQEALFFIPLPFFWLALSNKRFALIFLLVICVMLTLGYFYFQHASEGWYSYYVYAMPAAKSRYYGYFRALAAPAEVFQYWGIALLLIGTAIVVPNKQLARLKIRSVESLWVIALVSAILQFCAHRGDQMAGNNVLYPLCTMMPIVFSYAVWRLKKTGGYFTGISDWALLIQLSSFLYIPQHYPMMFPGAVEQAKADRFMAYLRSIPGDVVIPAHGFLTTLAGKKTHTHCQIEDDVLVMRDSVSAAYQESWREAYLDHRFGAILWDKSPAHDLDSIPGYTLVGSIPSSLQMGSKMGNGFVRPTYLYIPK